MSKTVLIYWTMSGNTQAMAEAIANALTNVVPVPVSDASLGDVQEADIVLLGCPAMGDEVLEESEFQPFFDEILADLSGKSVGLFGAYGWGDGQWMRDWEATVNDANGNVKATWIVGDGDLSGVEEFTAAFR